MITKVAPTEAHDLRNILTSDLVGELFPSDLELVPQLNELYELQLAYYESRILSPAEIIRRGGYFARVNGQPTRHFLMCRGEPLKLADHSSSRLKAFFQTNQFKTGYATHGLFPYRGKFHPQMVKGILNLMGLGPGDTVLDPMMGSGTTLIEATLMGVDSVGLDASPFCTFMAQAKLDGLSVPLGPLEWCLKNAERIFEHFTQTAGHPTPHRHPPRTGQVKLALERSIDPRTSSGRNLRKALAVRSVRNYLLLAFLDGAGYSIRSQRRSPFEQFRAILDRYVFVARKTQSVLQGVESELGRAKALEGDARSLPLGAQEVDGILFSPPYSFAIDYVANDAFHLQTMKVDIPKLKTKMVGLRGGVLKEKYELYVQDMSKVLAECARVLRPGKFCTIVAGTNDRQLAGILGVQPEEVKGIHELLTDLAKDSGFGLVRSIERQITGMANTMRSERILLLQKV